MPIINVFAIRIITYYKNIFNTVFISTCSPFLCKFIRVFRISFMGVSTFLVIYAFVSRSKR